MAAADDLKWFKNHYGTCHCYGSQNWEFPGPLPGRENWVLSRTFDTVDGIRVFRSLDEVKRAQDRLFIIGGGELYSVALKDCDELFLTEVNRVVENGDAFFPEYSELFSPLETLHECEDFKLRRWEKKSGLC